MNTARVYFWTTLTGGWILVGEHIEQTPKDHYDNNLPKH